MTDQSSTITPPPELVQQWLCSDDYSWGPLEQTSITITANRLQNIATVAAQWGADQELEACCSIALTALCCGTKHQRRQLVYRIRAARRPKPPSLKEQALLQLDTLNADLTMHGRGCDLSQIRRALEALPND
jgi:hypothetical protein